MPLVGSSCHVKWVDTTAKPQSHLQTAVMRKENSSKQQSCPTLSWCCSSVTTESKGGGESLRKLAKCKD